MKNMKYTLPWNFSAFSSAILATGLLASGSLFGQIFYVHGGTDNSALLGGGQDSTLDIGASWQDNYFSAVNPTAAANNFSSFGDLNANTTSAVPSFFGDSAVISFGVGDRAAFMSQLGITSTSQIADAQLYFYVQAQTGQTDWNITGLNAGNDSWNSVNSTYNDLDDTSAVDWANGGNVIGELATVYGTETISSAGFFQAFDITLALRAYLDGTISGILFENAAFNGGNSNVTNNAIQFSSNENGTLARRPGLLVAVPEPSATALLFGLGAIGFLGLRRRN